MFRTNMKQMLVFGGDGEKMTQMLNSRLEADGNLTRGLFENTATKGTAEPENLKLD